MQIGRKLYYDLATGNIIVNTGERLGSVIETTQEQDFAAYAALAERVPETVGMLQLDYGEYAQDFLECNGYKIDVTGDTPSLVFSYPDPDDPEEPLVYRKPLSVEVAELRAENASLRADGIDMMLALTEVYEQLLAMQGGGS
ncbi:hypothetical protein [Paenibacillus cymbidii]|uniref:hypothetical protein n=1 Tax=Paenibacillus cymbidii TaxID=1639034 RepID=UPI001080A392|nr:hypothetical protein [Paenibacillus cymbidii]